MSTSNRGGFEVECPLGTFEDRIHGKSHMFGLRSQVYGAFSSYK